MESHILQLACVGNHKAVEEEIKRVNGMSKLNLEALSDTATNVTNKMVDVPSPIKKALQVEHNLQSPSY